MDYTVVEVTPVTARDDGNTYRVELSYGDGAETIIYIDENTITISLQREILLL